MFTYSHFKHLRETKSSNYSKKEFHGPSYRQLYERLSWCVAVCATVQATEITEDLKRSRGKTEKIIGKRF